MPHMGDTSNSVKPFSNASFVRITTSTFAILWLGSLLMLDAKWRRLPWLAGALSWSYALSHQHKATPLLRKNPVRTRAAYVTIGTDDARSF